MVQQQAAPSAGELASVLDLAEEHGMGESTAWLLVKRHDLDRFRLPGRGKKTFVRRSDFERAIETPIPIGAGTKKRRREVATPPPGNPSPAGTGWRTR